MSFLFVVWCFSFCCVSFSLFFFFDAHKPPSSYGTHVARWFGARIVLFLVVAARLFLVFASFLLLCWWSAHKSLAPRTRTLLGVLGQAALSFFFFFFINTRPKSKSPRPNSGRVSPSYRSDPIPLGQGQACGTRTGKRKMGTSRFLRKRIHGWRHASKRPFSGPWGTKNHAGVPGMWVTA